MKNVKDYSTITEHGQSDKSESKDEFDNIETDDPDIIAMQAKMKEDSSLSERPLTKKEMNEKENLEIQKEVEELMA